MPSRHQRLRFITADESTNAVIGATAARGQVLRRVFWTLTTRWFMRTKHRGCSLKLMTATDRPRVHPQTETDPVLLERFWGYEHALSTNDVAALDELFWDDATTTRADHQSGVLVGHQEIALFRAGRVGGAPPRTITAVHVNELADGVVVILAETCRRDGARGLQTQIWRLARGQWYVQYAHVSAGAPRDQRVWRVVGDPLVPAAGDGPLSGLDVAVKDTFAIAGHAIGGGSPAYLAAAAVETTTALAVATLVGAGASVVGLAHTDELAYSLAGINPHYGTPPNPQAPERIPGGSTSGPAAAVALGETHVGLGTDTAGSIRVPASYQGLFGMRPTHGAVATQGVLPLAPSFDTVGWLTRDLATLTSVGDALLPIDAVDARHAGDGIVYGAVVDPALVAMADPAVAQQFLSHLRAVGVAHEYRDVVGDDLERWFAAFRTVQAWEAWQAHGEFLTTHPYGVADAVAGRFRAASLISSVEAGAARDEITQARRRLTATLVDGLVLLLPSTSSPAPRRDAPSAVADVREATLRLTCVASLSGRPAVSVPALRVDGAPVGLSAIGWRGGDQALLKYIARLEVS